jgi:hypothetical protein
MTTTTFPTTTRTMTQQFQKSSSRRQHRQLSQDSEKQSGETIKQTRKNSEKIV